MAVRLSAFCAPLKSRRKQSLGVPPARPSRTSGVGGGDVAENDRLWILPDNDVARHRHLIEDAY